MTKTATTHVNQAVNTAPIGMSVQDFATATGWPRMTVNRWANGGKVKVIKVDGKKRVTSNPAKFVRVSKPTGMSVKEFADACGVTRMTVNRWANDGKVKVIKVNGTKRVTSNPAKFVRVSKPTGMSVKEFADACGVTRMTANRWANDGKVKIIKVNGTKRITSDPAMFQLH